MNNVTLNNIIKARAIVNHAKGTVQALSNPANKFQIGTIGFTDGKRRQIVIDLEGKQSGYQVPLSAATVQSIMNDLQAGFEAAQTVNAKTLTDAGIDITS